MAESGRARRVAEELAKAWRTSLWVERHRQAPSADSEATGTGRRRGDLGRVEGPMSTIQRPRTEAEAERASSSA